MDEIEPCISIDANGFYFCNHFLAKEIVSSILIVLDFQSTLSCRAVCKQWNLIISDPYFWKKKTLNENKKWPRVPLDRTLSWRFYASVYINTPFDRNLILNSNGNENLEHWRVLSQGGNKFAVESPPVGSDEVPLEAENGESINNTCFATSFHSCSKEQVIDITTMGISNDVKRKYKPKIIFRDWYAGRFDCGCVYECKFTLLSEQMDILDSFEFRGEIKQWEGRSWHKVEHVFESYPDNVRYLKFYHGGMDTNFWAGHYGAKMTGSAVFITFL